MILRRGTDESHTTNVNVFDGIRVGDVWFGDSLFKRIEVDCDKINVVPAEVEELSMVFVGGTSKESAVNRWVKRFDSSAKNFRRFGIVCDFGDGDIVLAQLFC